MRFFKTPYQLFSIFICLMLTLNGCADDVLTEIEPQLPPAEPAGSSAFITLNVLAPVQTRSGNTPSGGENGDGTEEGAENENKIENLTVFFYQPEGDNETLTQAALKGRTLLAVEYFTNLTLVDNTTYTTETKEVKLKDGTYKILVVANTPHLSFELAAGDKLSKLCEYTQRDSPWTLTGGKDHSQFIMSSGEEKTIILRAQGTSQERPSYISGIKMQRLAARIDFVPTHNNRYEIPNFELNVEAVKVVNRMIAGTYLLKHTSEDIQNGPITYLGKEELTEDKRARNYVVDPWSSGKKPGQLDEYKTIYEERAGETHTWSEDDHIKTPAIGKTAYTLAYVQENTTSKEAQLCGYSTGIIIKVKAKPEKVINQSGKEEANSQFTDFCIYQDKVYKNAAALTAVTGIGQKDFETKGVKVYPGGVMYYPYFIRHCYNGSTANAIMEFAIVRNNIYKLRIDSFSSLGNTDDTVDPETPSKETFVMIGATILPWNVLDDENIVM